MSENAAPTLIKSLVERYERLVADKKAIEADMSEVLGEVHAGGFNKKVFKKLVAKRATDSAQASEEESLVDLYEQAMERV